MKKQDLNLNVGMLCSCCDYHSYRLPDVEVFTVRQRQAIEDLCKLCIENFRMSAAKPASASAPQSHRLSVQGR